MSPGHKPRPSTSPRSDAAGVRDSKLAANGNSSRAASNISKEDRMEAGGKDKRMTKSPNNPNDLQPPGHGNDSQPEAVSVACAPSQSEVTRTSTRSNRRSRDSGEQHNGDTRYKEQDSSANSSEVEQERCTYIDALASSLARLDEEAYKKAVLQDANAILEKLIIPMSFPWAHPITPVVRTIPRDIDEMPAIQMIDDAEHEMCSLKHNNFDLARRDASYSEDKHSDDEDKEDFRAVARRADDPGILELVTCARPLSSAGVAARQVKSSILLKDPVVETAHGPGNLLSAPSRETDVNTPGELSYRVFEQVQDAKRRKMEAGMARLKTTMISIKVGSTSSRPLLFNKSDSQLRLPLLLPALMPQDFRPMAKSRQKDRIPPGRSQLIWMEKIASKTSHRVSFKSYLSNEKVESGSQKRPRDVTVGIRVNGKLLTSPSVTSEDIVQAQTKDGSSSKRKRDGKPASLYSTKYVNEALDEACAGTEPRLGTRQCSMDTEEFTKRVLSSEVTRDKSKGWNLKVSIKRLNVIYVRPQIHCFPTEDGLLHVLCTSPGELQPSNVHEVLNEASRKKATPVCTVCWRDTSITGEDVSECSDCGILVHGKCCQSTESAKSPRWKCNICSQLAAPPATQNSGHQDTSATPSPNERSARRSSRVKDGSSPSQGKNTPCFLCPHRGGSMSTLKLAGQSVWAHDVCRMWSDQSSAIDKNQNGVKTKPRAGPDRADLICALCGTLNPAGDASNGIVKCGATGCSIYFHPMCALFLSKCEDVRMEDPASREEDLSSKSIAATKVQDPRLKNILDEDSSLCRQYSLRFAKCAIPGGVAEARLPSSAVLPVCFCGIHNPSRDRSLYGLYPGGKHVDEQIMRVPPKRVDA